MLTIRGIAKSVAGFAAGVAAVVLFSGAAFAHIDPDPPAVEAGKAATVAFDLEHGCNDSPTTSLQFKIPDGVTAVKAGDKAGWRSSVDATSVSFSGGSQDAHTPTDFEISFTAPTSPGETAWLIVQKCTVGENDWFDKAVEGQPEPDLPAATIRVTAGPPTSDDLYVAPDATEAPASEATTAGTATTATATAGAAASATTSASASATTSAGASATTTTPAAKNASSGHTGLVVVVILVVVIVGAGAFIATKRSSAKRDQGRPSQP